MEESLEGDHGILLATVEWLEDALVVPEVLVQLQMMDRQQRHRRVEIFLLFMEVKVHSTEVNFQLRRVLLLLEQLHLSLSLLTSLPLLELFLGLACLSLLFLILLLFQVVKFLLSVTRDRLRCAVLVEEWTDSIVLRQVLWLFLFVSSSLLTIGLDFLEVNLGFIGAVW